MGGLEPLHVSGELQARSGITSVSDYFATYAKESPNLPKQYIDSSFQILSNVCLAKPLIRAAKVADQPSNIRRLPAGDRFAAILPHAAFLLLPAFGSRRETAGILGFMR